MCAPMTRLNRVIAASLISAAVAWRAVNVMAADQWIEVTSAHFAVLSNAGERSARTLVWQLEQVRSAITALWSWARVDLNKPLRIIAVKDEYGLKTLAPQYWEERASARPASVWVTGLDRHYLAIRTDVEVEDRLNINPYMTAYFSYIGLVMGQSLDPDLPIWFSRGFTGVLSNTIVRDDHLLVGAPIPWDLAQLRDRPILPLAKLVTVTRQSPEFAQGDKLQMFDAQAWAFVHFLMFGDQGARADKLNQFARLVTSGKDAATAFQEALGTPESLENPYRTYLQRAIYSFRRFNIDVSVERERFPVRPLPPAESAAERALFHAAMRRPVESRAAIAEAQKADANVAGSYEAEGILFDYDSKPQEAKAAFTKAVERGSTSAYANYRLASLMWTPDRDRDALVAIEKRLSEAVRLNIRYAAAYAWLGEVRASLGIGSEPLSLVRRAISLEPANPDHRLSAARILRNAEHYDEAAVEAKTALTLADSDGDRREAQELLGSIEAAKARVASRSTATAAPAAGSPAAGASTAAATDANALSTACQSGDDAACGKLLPFVEGECAKRDGSACGFAASLYERGKGVPADPAKAAGLYQQACDAANRRACFALAVLQVRGLGVPKDVAKGRATLEAGCTEGVFEACTNLALVAANSTPPDFARARELLTKSCDGKFAPACELLKKMPQPRH
jgi:TPR repeat protein